MSFVKVKWKHSFLDEPVLFYMELEENRWEIRKIEVFPDGHRGYASAIESTSGTGLGKRPTPPLAEIAAISQFEPTEISREEFEYAWANRRGDRGAAN